MPHIALPEHLPGIRAAMAFRPETTKPLNARALGTPVRDGDYRDKWLPPGLSVSWRFSNNCQ